MQIPSGLKLKFMEASTSARLLKRAATGKSSNWTAGHGLLSSVFKRTQVLERVCQTLFGLRLNEAHRSSSSSRRKMLNGVWRKTSKARRTDVIFPLINLCER